MSKQDFEDFMLCKNDEIDNAAYNLAVGLLRLSPEQSSEDILSWDMAVIAPIVDAAEKTLKSMGKEICWPFHENDRIPCYKSSDCGTNHCRYMDEVKEAQTE